MQWRKFSKYTHAYAVFDKGIMCDILSYCVVPLFHLRKFNGLDKKFHGIDIVKL